MITFPCFCKSSLLFAVGAVMVMDTGQAGRLYGSDLNGRLANLFGQYRLIKTVDMKALAEEKEYVSLLPVPRPGRTSIGTLRWHYKAEGRKYYVKTVPSPGFVAGGSYIITYNGHQYDFFDRADGNLYFRTKDMRSCPVLSPNPFFYPVSFLDTTSDQRFSYAIMLWQARSRKTENRIIAVAHWEQYVPPGYSAVAEVPANGTMNKRPFLFKIFFGRDVAYLPIRVESVYRKGGGTIWRYDILSYAKTIINGHPFYWMKSGRLRGYTQRGQVCVDSRTDVQKCVFNKRLPDGDFSVDFRLAQRIFTITTGKTRGREVYARGGLRPPSPAIWEPMASWWPTFGLACAAIVIGGGALIFFLYKRIRHR
jgi:hypothetical protein